MSIEIDNSAPLLVAFRADWHAVNIMLAKQTMFNSNLFRFKVCEDWSELALCLEEAPALLVFHQDMPRISKVTTSEFVSMMSILCRCKHIDTKVAVSIDRPCSAELFKELKSTEILGIIPSIAGFGVDASLDAIQNLLAGKSHWPAIALAKPTKKREAITNEIVLTNRQEQVISLIRNRGISNKKIAAMLHITESTVKAHVSEILKKYGVRNRTQLALVSKPAELTK